MAKDGSIHRAPICDMVPEGYHHRPGNGLILRFKFSGYSKKFVLFIHISLWFQRFVDLTICVALSFTNSICHLLIVKQTI